MPADIVAEAQAQALLRGAEAAVTWVERRLATQVGYALTKQLRGIYDERRSCQRS
jgi:hypothetical protein